MVGDWNADFLKVGDDKYYNKRILGLIVDTMRRHGFSHLIEGGTHEQGGKWRCINLFFTNRKKKSLVTTTWWWEHTTT